MNQSGCSALWKASYGQKPATEHPQLALGPQKNGPQGLSLEIYVSFHKIVDFLKAFGNAYLSDA